VPRLETVDPARLELAFRLDLVHDFVDLGEDVAVGGGFGLGDAVDARDGLGGVFVPTAGCEPSVKRERKVLAVRRGSGRRRKRGAHLGDSGMTLIPMMSMAGKISPIPMRSFHEAMPPSARVPNAIESILELSAEDWGLDSRVRTCDKDTHRDEQLVGCR
jgi:hypothetical protein